MSDANEMREQARKMLNEQKRERFVNAFDGLNAIMNPETDAEMLERLRLKAEGHVVPNYTPEDLLDGLRTGRGSIGDIPRLVKLAMARLDAIEAELAAMKNARGTP